MLEKLIITLREFRKTANHHYGANGLSLLRFLYYSLFRVNTFVAYGADLEKDLPVFDLASDYRIILPTLQELDELRQGLDLPREFYYDKIHHVKECYLVMHGQEIAYIHWVYFQGDPSRFVRLKQGTAELNYNTTLPKFRGQGLMGKMMTYITSDLKRRGYKRVVGIIHEKNYPARRSAEKAGWSEIRRIRALGPFNRKFRF